MVRWLTFVLHRAVAGLKSRRNLLLKILALRHQLLVLSRNPKRPRLTPLDRVLWAWLPQAWAEWKTRLVLVQPGTVLQWHRAGFRTFWRWKSCPRKTGRKAISPVLITLIRDMNHANPLWGAPRIHGELLRLGITLAQRTIANYTVPRARGPSPQNCKAFLHNY